MTAALGQLVHAVTCYLPKDVFEYLGVFPFTPRWRFPNADPDYSMRVFRLCLVAGDQLYLLNTK